MRDRERLQDCGGRNRRSNEAGSSHARVPGLRKLVRVTRRHGVRPGTTKRTKKTKFTKFAKFTTRKLFCTKEFFVNLRLLRVFVVPAQRRARESELDTIGSLNSIVRPLRRTFTEAVDPIFASEIARDSCDGSS